MKYLYLTGLLLSLLFLQSCEKDIMDYEGVDGLFFDVQYGFEWGDTVNWGHQIYSLVAFGKMEEEEKDLEARIKVAVAGNIKDYDRPFEIVVVQDSTTALSPDEYEPIAGEYVIKAGMNHTYITMKCHKTKRMKDGSVRVQIRLLPNEHFALPFIDLGVIPGRIGDTEYQYGQNTDPSIHTVFINDFLVQPKAWNDNILGKFSPTKFQLMLDKTGWPKSYFDAIDTFQAGRREMVRRIMMNYLNGEYAKGRKYWVLDEDGSMMWVSGCRWAKGTMPDEMVQN